MIIGTGVGRREGAAALVLAAAVVGGVLFASRPASSPTPGTSTPSTSTSGTSTPSTSTSGATTSAEPAPVDERVTLTGDPSCILGSALPAGTEPVPQPPAEPAPATTPSGLSVPRPHRPDVLLMVQPDAGMAARVQQLVGVPVQEAYRGRVVRFRLDPNVWARLARRADYLPGVWGEILAPGDPGPSRIGQPAVDPATAAARTEMTLRRAAASAKARRAGCAEKLREGLQVRATHGLSCPTVAELAARRKALVDRQARYHRVVDPEVDRYALLTERTTVTVLVTAPGTTPRDLARVPGATAVKASAAAGGALRVVLPTEDAPARVMDLSQLAGVRRIVLDPAAAAPVDDTQVAFGAVVDGSRLPPPAGCPPHGR